VNSFRKLLRFFRFGPDGDDSAEHSVPPFGSSMVRQSLCPTDSRVNCRKMVQGASKLRCTETHRSLEHRN
jgi:hypothetical protein